MEASPGRSSLVLSFLCTAIEHLFQFYILSSPKHSIFFFFFYILIFSKHQQRDLPPLLAYERRKTKVSPNVSLLSLSLSLPLSLARQHDSRIDESKNRRRKISISSGSRRFFFFPLLLFAIKVTEYPSKKLRCVSDTYLTGEPLIDGSMDQPAN